MKKWAPGLPCLPDDGAAVLKNNKPAQKALFCAGFFFSDPVKWMQYTKAYLLAKLANYT